MNSSTTKDLREPLLRLAEIDCDGSNNAKDEEAKMTETLQQQQPSDGEVLMFCGWHGFVDEWHRSFAGVFMTLMLVVQFRVACRPPNSNVEFDACLMTQIVCFGLAGCMFRQALTGAEDTAVQLWPEITTDILLLAILLGYTEPAMWLMNVLSLSFCLHASWNHWEVLKKRHAEGSLDLTLHMRGYLPTNPPTYYNKKVDGANEGSVTSLVEDMETTNGASGHHDANTVSV